ncbi:hypothetical protein KKA14_05250, partial [bacterium]|nr:hypothetical protein [bacterium]
MSTINNEQIEKLLEDVSSIKQAINKNRSVLRHILLPRHYRLLSFLLGIIIIFHSAIYYFLVEHYGSYGLIPDGIKNVWYSVIAITWALLAFLKIYKLEKSLSKIDKKYSLSRTLFELFSFRIVHIYVPIMATLIAFIVHFANNELSYYIIPAISISFGILYNVLGAMTEIKQYLISGYWMVFIGVIAVIYTSISGP